jgi:predicted nuclease of predicted toxin-antitoxin system
VKFLVDESSGQSIVSCLRALGHDVASVQEESPGIEDGEVCEWANRDQRIIVTNDKGFSELIFRERIPNRGIILLRLRNETAVNRIRVISKLLAGYQDRIRDHFVVASETSVRIRPLP